MLIADSDKPVTLAGEQGFDAKIGAEWRAGDLYSRRGEAVTIVTRTGWLEIKFCDSTVYISISR